MKKGAFLILILLIVGISVSYFIPTQKKDFFELYTQEDKASKSLKEFLQRPVKNTVINGNTWKYYSGGKGEKTILFVHGMGGAYDLWWQQVIAFENDYKVITFSLPEDIKTLKGAAGGILKILEEENVTNLYIVGTSMGGYISQYLLHKIPNRIEKVVFSNTFPPNNLLRKDNESKSKIIPYLPEIVISKFGEKKLNSELIPAAKDSKLLAAFLPSLPFSKKQFMNRFYVVVDYFSATSSNYTLKRVPKLIIESDNDPLVKKELREMLKELYPEANIHSFHNEGHFPYINAADQYNLVLKNFFEQEDSFQEVEKTIKNYFEGRKTANVGQLQTAFTEEALLYSTKNNKQLRISFSDYLEKVQIDGQQEVSTRIIEGSITKDMASFKTEFSYPDKTYQDYLILLKIEGNWKIISKTFQETTTKTDLN